MLCMIPQSLSSRAKRAHRHGRHGPPVPTSAMTRVMTCSTWVAQEECAHGRHGTEMPVGLQVARALGVESLSHEQVFSQIMNQISIIQLCHVFILVVLAGPQDLVERGQARREAEGGGFVGRVGWQDLSNATCLVQALFVVCVVHNVRDHHNLLHSSQLLGKTCFRQAVLDKWFPLDPVERGQAR